MYMYIQCVHVCTLSLLNSWWFQLESQQTVVFGIRIYTLLQIPTNILSIATLNKNNFCQMLVISVITDGMAISNILYCSSVYQIAIFII